MSAETEGMSMSTYSVEATQSVQSNTWVDPWNQTAVPWQPYIFPSYVYTYTGWCPEDYANDVEVVRGAHDATLSFYRKRGSSRTHIRTITVPLALLDSIGA